MALRQGSSPSLYNMETVKCVLFVQASESRNGVLTWERQTSRRNKRLSLLLFAQHRTVCDLVCQALLYYVATFFPSLWHESTDCMKSHWLGKKKKWSIWPYLHSLQGKGRHAPRAAKTTSPTVVHVGLIILPPPMCHILISMTNCTVLTPCLSSTWLSGLSVK